MSVLAWGKPKVEVAAYVDGALPASPSWIELPTIKEGSSQLTTSKGTKAEAKGEGGEVVDVRYGKSAYQFVCEVFVKKGDTKTIQDTDGLVVTNYALRLTPEDAETEGFILDKTAVTVDETWSSADGKMLKYTFDALKPATGNMCKPYVATT